MFDPDETLTYEQILHRFEKIFNRKMTPTEKSAFFLDLPIREDAQSEDKS
ncbi:MAG: hypothetical protein ACYDDS_08155 [Candidatus Sulfotelmatobacter sp.]